jgi:hypothetical protein
MSAKCQKQTLAAPTSPTDVSSRVFAKSKDNSRQRVSRGFHRLGIIIALMAGAVSLVLIAHDTVTVRLWEVAYGDLPVVLVGVVEVAVVCLAVYVLIRAIGWVINNVVPS